MPFLNCSIVFERGDEAMTAWETKTLPIFRGLNPLQIHMLIQHAEKAEYSKDTIICHASEK